MAAWILTAGLMAWLIAPADTSGPGQATYLPDDSRYAEAIRVVREHFPSRGGLSSAVVVFERRDGALTEADMTAVESVANAVGRPSDTLQPGDMDGVTVRSPADVALPRNPLTGRPVADNPQVSPDRQATLIVVGIPANFITTRASRIVDHARQALAGRDLPRGLSAAVTGSGAFGHDYAVAAERSSRSTLWVTLAAVVLILLAVYRAPLAAGAALGAISLAAVVALSLLAAATHVGVQAGTAERIFVIVLLYGAGVDYSLMLISRYRETLAERPHAEALPEAMRATLGAIVASGGTDAAGLMMLCLAGFGLFRTTGGAVAMALGVALLAAVTLVPALLAVLGRRAFWPAHRRGDASGTGVGRRTVWPRLATTVTRRPVLIGGAVLLLLAAPVIQATRITWVYDTLADLAPHYGAVRGLRMAKRHWPVGEIAPVSVLLESDKPLKAGEWLELTSRATAAASAVDGVRNVRSLTQPIGAGLDPVAATLVATLGAGQARAQYVSDDTRAMRMEIVLDSPALTLTAMDKAQRVRHAVRRALSRADASVDVHLAGVTAEMTEVREVTGRDFRLIVPLVLGVILLVVVTLLRDLALAGFMTACTVLSYLATLGITSWVFTAAFGAEGLDWKVQVFLFVVIAAVGVDYNIFLAARLAEESRRFRLRKAVRRAVVHTGPVISSCGLIMAATLGSLMAGDLLLLRELGFAMALGMLLDTFVIRPLLLPAFVMLTGRTGRRAALRRRD